MLRGRKIAIVGGGPGSEREISLASARSVREALEPSGATLCDIDVRGEDFESPEGTELVFNLIHGTFGEDGVNAQIGAIRWRSAGGPNCRILCLGFAFENFEIIEPRE